MAGNSECLSTDQCPLWVKSGHSPRFVRCPLYPQKRTFASVIAMSALCQKRTSDASDGLPELAVEPASACGCGAPLLDIISASPNEGGAGRCPRPNRSGRVPRLINPRRRRPPSSPLTQPISAQSKFAAVWLFPYRLPPCRRCQKGHLLLPPRQRVG